jgi:hypothetical protein
LVAIQPKESPNDNKQGQRDFTIRPTSRLVLLDVSVEDPQGAFGTGLDRDNFKVYKDGILQRISEFATADLLVTASWRWTRVEAWGLTSGGDCRRSST